jgi:FMN-dependent NADH-azoreductase
MSNRYPGQQFLRADDAEGLKALIDHIVRIRRTFPIDARRQNRPLHDRRVVVTNGDGGYLTSPPMHPSLWPRVQHFFETIGINLLEFVRVEGIACGPKAVARALDAADAWIERRLPRLLGGR